MYKKLTYLMVILFLTGCGFHLRGAFIIPEGLKKLVLTSHDVHDPFQQELQYAFSKRGVTVVAAQKDVPTLNISHLSFSSQVLGLSANGQAQQFRMHFHVAYTLTAATGRVLKSNRFQVSQDFSADPNTVLNNDTALEVYKRELRQEAAMQLLRQLSAIKELKQTEPQPKVETETAQ